MSEELISQTFDLSVLEKRAKSIDWLLKIDAFEIVHKLCVRLSVPDTCEDKYTAISEFSLKSYIPEAIELAKTLVLGV